MPELLPDRVVLDTNTVMALWLFEDPRLMRLRHAVEAGRLQAVARSDALEELRRVLAYRQFGVPPARQADLLDAYAARVVTVDFLPSPCAAAQALPAVALPTCRDQDDQKFLEIARDGGARHLLSRDKALLRLARHRLLRPLFQVSTPEAFERTLEAGVTPP